MLNWNEFTVWAGYAGTAIVVIAYIPQVFHLIAMKCSEGISLRAYAMWSLGSLLLLIHALSIDAPVFIALTGFQLGATLVIALFSWKYEGRRCVIHQH